VSIRGLALWFYQRIITHDVGRLPNPSEIALIITDSDLVERDARLKLKQFLLWCLDLEVECVSVYISVLDHHMFDAFIKEMVEDLKHFFSGVPARCIISTPSGDEVLGRNKRARKKDHPRVYISVGMGGRHEILEALRSLAEDVESGHLDPDDIEERDIACRLKIPSEPDLIIRTGEVRLPDFLLWQAAYSEFHFSDVNWVQFRRIDLLRAVRDYQLRQRRFGR